MDVVNRQVMAEVGSGAGQADLAKLRAIAVTHRTLVRIARFGGTIALGVNGADHIELRDGKRRPADSNVPDKGNRHGRFLVSAVH
ncbi:hypothetical protein E1193_00150 [Micromonospora sp. KC606]|nr:hypothetical protein E1193_00150 [Micromonospora sp. KC606]